MEAVRILVAESNLGVREVYRELLHRAGAQVVACQSRYELEIALHTGPYNAVIADPHMRDGSANNTLLELRCRQPDLPILLVTTPQTIDPLVAMAARGIFFKPLFDLVEVIRWALTFARGANAEQGSLPLTGPTGRPDELRQIV